MKTLLLSLTLLISINTIFAQDDERRILRGQVLYRDVSVPNENVINVTSERATITDDQGRFAIAVKEGDDLAFTAVNYEMQVVKISDEILKKNRLVVEVNEKVTELDEIIVTPEDKERFLQVKNEEFKEFEYEVDRSTEVENAAMRANSQQQIQDGLNIANIFRALFKSNTSEEVSGPKLKVSEVLRQVYDDEFFVVDLKLPQDQIGAFLVYTDDKLPEQSLLKKSNEFQLIDFLVTQSREFRKTLDGKE
ncbi:hypothetical protein [Maribacter halichondriae]|uniref:hypothetical protein n=1 Tax=Maribacter halichondriae TaxID=2980554 RepID=UPI00235A118D|nr:hypothetical protein [Maribacter sp. Hal144]